MRWRGHSRIAAMKAPAEVAALSYAPVCPLPVPSCGVCAEMPPRRHFWGIGEGPPLAADIKKAQQRNGEGGFGPPVHVAVYNGLGNKVWET